MKLLIKIFCLYIYIWLKGGKEEERQNEGVKKGKSGH
jgi:hypothetical protein